MSKALEYQGWLNQLKQTSDKDFFSLAEDFFTLLEKENRSKIKVFEKELEKRDRTLSRAANKAVQEFRPLYNKIKKAALKAAKSGEKQEFVDTTELEYINSYELYLSKKITITPDDPVEEIFTAIRFTLELLVNSKRLTKFKKYMKKANGNYFVHSQQFPAYLEYLQIRDHFTERRENTAWGAYFYFKRMLVFFHNANQSMDNWIRGEFITKFIRLILYLTTPQAITKKTIRSSLGIKKLFQLSKHPPKILYEGINKEDRGWKPTKGKTQTYAMLYYFATKVNEKEKRREGNIKQLSLPFSAISKYLHNLKNCDRPPNWTQIVLPFRQAKVLVKNAKKAISFADNEIFTENTNKGIFITLRVAG